MTSKQPDICMPRMWMWCVHLPRFDNVSVLPARSTGWAFLAIRPCHLSIISSSRSQFSIDEITQGPRHALANHCLRERGSDWSNFEDTLKPGASISPPYPCIIHMFSRPHRTLEDGDKRFDGRELGLFLETSSKPCKPVTQSQHTECPVPDLVRGFVVKKQNSARKDRRESPRTYYRDRNT